MNEQIKRYVESLFEDAPQTKATVELRDEIMQNTNERYNDLITEGKSEKDAFNIAISGIGDTNELLATLKPTQPEYTKEEIERDRQKNALLLSVSIMMYILCIIPPILFDDNIAGVILMFVMIAAATGLIVYNNMTRLRYEKQDDTMVEEFKEWKYGNRQQLSIFRAISSAVWAVAVAAYLLVSFSTMAWHITWVIFPLAASVTAIVKAVLDYKGANK